MQRRVTRSFKSLRSPLSHLYHVLLKQHVKHIKANSTRTHLSFFIKVLDEGARRGQAGGYLTFPICLGCPPNTSPHLLTWPGGCLAQVGKEACCWLHKCLFVAVAYCWCCLISWLESYQFDCWGAAVALISWKAARFGQLSMSTPSSLSLSLFLFIDICL